MASTNPNTPDWLKEDGPTPKGSISTAAADSNNFTTSLELDDGAPPPTPSSASDRGEKDCFSKFVKCMNWGTSLCLLAIFILSATFQENDGSGSLLWLIFYVAHATMVCLFFFFRACANVQCIDKPLLALGFSMFVFSIVMIAISGKKLADANPDDEGEDADNFNDKEEKAFEVAGASLGLFSAIYHIAIWKFCCQSAKQGNDE